MAMVQELLKDIYVQTLYLKILELPTVRLLLVDVLFKRYTVHGRITYCNTSTQTFFHMRFNTCLFDLFP